MGNRFAIGAASIVASGLTTLTFVTFLGSLFPSAPNDVARTHLIIAVILPFFGFLTAVLLTAGAYLFRIARLSNVWVQLPQIGSCLFNFLILILVTNQTTAALSEWFASSPGSSEDIDWIVQSGLLVGLLVVLAGLIVLLIRAFRKQADSE